MKPAAVLDIGSSKIVCLSGSFADRDGIAVRGAAVRPYAGYIDGVFTDHRALHTAIVDAVQQTEQESRERIREIAVNVPAPFAKLVMSEAAVPVNGKGKRVSTEEVDAVISDSLKKINAPGYVLMHSTPVSFTVGGVVMADIPVGARTDELGALVSHMYVQEEFVRAVEQALSAIEVEVSMCVSAELCNALTIIPERERIRPAVLIDVGYTHTDVSLVENAALIATATVPVGGKHITSDLCFGLDVPMESAEQVKRRYVFLQEPLSSTEIVRTPGGPKRVEHSAIELIVESRAGELVALIRSALRALGVSSEASPATYVTGGGLIMMKGATEYLKANLQLPVKRDEPVTQDMDTPNYTSAFAALDFVLRAMDDHEVVEVRTDGRVVDRLRNLFTK